MSIHSASRTEPAPEILEAARAWLRAVRPALGAEFLACYLTGSVLRVGFDPRQSRVNLLVLARTLPLTVLDAVTDALPADDRKGPNFDPLVLTESQVRQSLDAFPIEWIEIQETHLLLEGNDLLSELTVPRNNLRLQCEHELRVKLLRLRLVYLQSRRDPRALEPVLRGAASSFATLFRTLLRLRGEQPPAGTPQVVERVADLHRLDARALIGAYQVRFTDRKFTGEEMLTIYRQFLIEIERLVDVIDSLSVT